MSFEALFPVTEPIGYSVTSYTDSFDNSQTLHLLKTLCLQWLIAYKDLHYGPDRKLHFDSKYWHEEEVSVTQKPLASSGNMLTFDPSFEQEKRSKSKTISNRVSLGEKLMEAAGIDPPPVGT